MNKITKLCILLSMLWLGCIGAFARTKGATEAIYYSEPYKIYSPYYESATAHKKPRILFDKAEKPFVSEKKQEKKQKVNTPSEKSKFMVLGINAGAGFHGSSYDELKMTFGIDIAYPIVKQFGMGVYFSTGFFMEEGYRSRYYVSGMPFQLGLLTTIGNYHDRTAAFLFGIGWEYDTEWGHNANVRLGAIFKNGLKIYADMSGAASPFSMTFNIGYNFGALFKVR